MADKMWFYKFWIGIAALGWSVYAVSMHHWWALGMVPLFIIFGSEKFNTLRLQWSQRFGEHSILASSSAMVPMGGFVLFFARADLDGIAGAFGWAVLTDVTSFIGVLLMYLSMKK